MENRKHYAVVVGARPNFVKAASLFKRAPQYPNIKLTLIHTGQHFDKNMSKIFFDEMEISKPDINLNIKGDFHTEKLGKMFSALYGLFIKESYDGVILFGDTNSTLAGAVAAVNAKLSIIHIESGLRSHDRRMPEEINRAIVDHLSDVLFITEPVAKENLIKEGISENKINYVGNIMIESIEIFKDKFKQSDILNKLNLTSKKYVLVTLHRQENIDSKTTLRKLLKIINNVNETISVVFPVHPGTRKKIEDHSLLDLLENLNTLEPVGYLEFMKLIVESKGVITDSGGIQEETTHLGISCCTLRDNTERPITVELGSNKLFPIENININKSTKDILAHLNREGFKAKNIALWDNLVSKRIFSVLDCSN